MAAPHHKAANAFSMSFYHSLSHLSASSLTTDLFTDFPFTNSDIPSPPLGVPDSRKCLPYPLPHTQLRGWPSSQAIFPVPVSPTCFYSPCVSVPTELRIFWQSPCICLIPWLQLQPLVQNLDGSRPSANVYCMNK